jgi:hypothetical protein
MAWADEAAVRLAQAACARGTMHVGALNKPGHQQVSFCERQRRRWRYSLRAECGYRGRRWRGEAEAWRGLLRRR